MKNYYIRGALHISEYFSIILNPHRPRRFAPLPRESLGRPPRPGRPPSGPMSAPYLASHPMALSPPSLSPRPRKPNTGLSADHHSITLSNYISQHALGDTIGSMEPVAIKCTSELNFSATFSRFSVFHRYFHAQHH